MVDQLSLSLLGTFQVRLNDQPVSRFEYDKVRALLAYLAVEANFPHRRDVLAALLWPERSDREARHSLSQALLKCRQALGDQERVVPFLLADRHTVQWNPSALPQLDVHRFEALLSACAAHPHPRAETCAECMARRREAMALYGGDFLGGLSVGDSVVFEDWATLMRERLHRQAMDALSALARYHERRGEVERASHYARRQVELEPWREEAHRQLMRLLLYGGQRSAALAQYETCTRILGDELGVVPSAETRALYELIASAEPHPPHNLPPQPTPFVGRREELADVASLLANPDCRLLTLVGAGGMGKTRLALAAAERQLGRPADVPLPDGPSYAFFCHGVYFVPLVTVETAVALIPAVADVLGFRLETSVPGGGAPARSEKRQLFDYLRQKRMLLVLDNYEQLLEEEVAGAAVALLAEVLQAAPGVQLVLTSRERTQLPGEQVYDVQGLAYPEVPAAAETSPATLLNYAAPALFDQVARRVRPDFVCAGEEAVQVARICRYLAGMPLGIELAAAAVNVMSPAEIAAELASSLDLLSATARHVPARHRSVRAAFETSWRRLSPAEGDGFRKLSVFRGGFGRVAAGEVAGATQPVLSALVDKSFLRYRQAERRFEIHELLRQFGAEKLDGDGTMETAVRDRHCAFYCAFLQERGADLKGARQQVALAEIEAEIENAQHAWHWAIVRRHEKDLEEALEALCLFYEWRGRHQVGETACHEAIDMLERVDSGDAQRAMARLLTWQALFCRAMGRAQEGEGQLASALRVLDGPQLANTDTRAERAFALCQLGYVARTSDREEVRRLAEQSLEFARQLDDPWAEANAFALLGNIARGVGDYERARPLQERGLAIRQSLHDQRGIAQSLSALCLIAMDLGQGEEAEQFARRGLAILRKIGDRIGEAHALQPLGLALLHVGKLAEAQACFEESLTIFDALGDSENAIGTNLWIGIAEGLRGRYEDAIQLGHKCLGHFDEVSNPYVTAHAHMLLGWSNVATGAYAEAEQHLQKSIAIFRRLGQRNELGQALGYLSLTALGQGNLTQGQQYACESLRMSMATRVILSLSVSLLAIALVLIDKGEIEHA
ncbi:MAG: tetratricopeptide repeat protein, partial [Anaerolineae bacterium]|nr:tetratricopeptide repeat protein [Anaerolineae bacterium]